MGTWHKHKGHTTISSKIHRKYEATAPLKPVIHTCCETQIGWYRGAREDWPGFVMPSGNYTRMDGSSPDRWAHDGLGTMFFERCPTCDRRVGPMELGFGKPPPTVEELEAKFA